MEYIIIVLFILLYFAALIKGVKDYFNGSGLLILIISFIPIFNWLIFLDDGMG